MAEINFNIKMNILVIGNGGREHALVWKLKQSPKIKNIFIAPGNAGTSRVATNIPISKIQDIINWISKNPTDLVIVGPDNCLADGLVDKLNKLKVPVFGPTKAASEIEWSKAFAKKFMHEEGIPTARFEVFSDIKKASLYINDQQFPIVIKASGLAFGKGVIIAKDLKEANKALDEIMSDKIFGDAGSEVIIEEYLQGDEISLHAFCDGNTAILFPPSQDHKRIYDNDKGPNTGGMGTIAPVPWVTKKHMKDIEDKIVMPTLDALKRRGRPFKGILFPGVMITRNGPKVIEFNARFGDPETQSYMRILDTDLVDVIFACIDGTLDKQSIKWNSKSACCIVCASGGYPGEYKKGEVVSGLEVIKDSDAVVFHAGSKLKDGKTITNGGRVLGVTAVANTLEKALSNAYKVMESISFGGMQYRKDIGAKSVIRIKSAKK